jgi:hypothetical protein
MFDYTNNKDHTYKCYNANKDLIMPVNDLCYKLHIEWIDLALYQLADIVAGDA